MLPAQEQAIESAKTNSIDPNHRAVLTAGLIACAALGAVSLVVLDRPYFPDPNSWLVWAGQIAAGHGIDFSVGPSWKPLPVIASTPFSFVSPAFATLSWMWLVRACALATALLAALLVVRRYGSVAALISASLPFSIGIWNQCWLAGSAESVFTAAALGAFLAWSNGARRLAVLLAVVAGLLRPEAWLLLGALLIWEGRRDRRFAVAAGIASAVVLVTCWFALPALLGGGLTQAASRAGTISIYPDRGFFRGGLGQLPVIGIALIPLGVWAVVRRRDRVLIALGLGSLVYALEVIVGEWLGYSGIARYFLPATVGLMVLTGPGVATLISVVPSKAFRVVGTAVAVAAVIGSLAAAVGPARGFADWASYSVDSAARGADAFRAAGGIGRFAKCQPFGANGYMMRMLARELNLPLTSVRASVRAPTVVLANSELPQRALRVDARGQAPVLLAQPLREWAIVGFGSPAPCWRSAIDPDQRQLARPG